ncbi:hypothetical protein [Aminipila luticellarii]|uniref:Prophage pi2 protein 38 n=1 Tax=Aminipila luticellarii TaxID=2507160 RepID=A0A410PWX6_9FIRM|nr:hypothetical protein [Aminipila luticellarii]QAT43441.1 hypothetical protein EQM06_09560 [Aminipila luticellarii]
MEELLNLLKTTGLKAAYHHFEKAPPPPYIIYLFSGSDNFGADNKVYNKIQNYQVELYTNKKDINSEMLIENLFDEHDVFYDKDETYIESEKLYQVTYYIEF